MQISAICGDGRVIDPPASAFWAVLFLLAELCMRAVARVTSLKRLGIQLARMEVRFPDLFRKVGTPVPRRFVRGGFESPHTYVPDAKADQSSVIKAGRNTGLPDKDTKS
ncbi:hypothetical protein [Sinorhizobium mexicanum]|uniref:Uncharacterized protein n=1 Tax=Sinorhizobium mexicanum TaxID=375549 RepID=A0A859QMN6_9HYPH|nr:hypothetical protein [Sinorhizobium mexicanum]MBP1881768.1 hypothetical protein [Sinorhizobium mexicanum]QLL61526.1 hypothetical protein FKV68_08725 [Sinorhizobium mexicanum]